MFVLPKNDLVHYSFTIKKARNRLNVGKILSTIHLLPKRPGRGAWDFIDGGGLLIQGGDYPEMGFPEFCQLIGIPTKELSTTTY